MTGTPRNFLLDVLNDASQPTKVTSSGLGTSALWGRSTNVGEGVRGTSLGGLGVMGESMSGPGVGAGSVSNNGIVGQSEQRSGIFGVTAASDWPGVLGSSNNIGVYGHTGANDSGIPKGPSNTGVYGLAEIAGGTGVMGQSLSTGVFGNATEASAPANGVFGQSISPTGHGVAGYNGAGSGLAVGGRFTTASPVGDGVIGTATGGQGVHGEATTGRGVHGEATSGLGVRGYATSGTGGSFEAITGYALRAVGRVKLDGCAGVATIASGTKSIVVTPGIDLVASSAVVATLQGNPAGTTTVRSVAVNATANTFTIYLTAKSTVNVKVAWHVFG